MTEVYLYNKLLSRNSELSKSSVTQKESFIKHLLSGQVPTIRMPFGRVPTIGGIGLNVNNIRNNAVLHTNHLQGNS